MTKAEYHKARRLIRDNGNSSGGRVIAAYNRHCLRAKAQGFTPLTYQRFTSIAWDLV